MVILCLFGCLNLDIKYILAVHGLLILCKTAFIFDCLKWVYSQPRPAISVSRKNAKIISILKAKGQMSSSRALRCYFWDTGKWRHFSSVKLPQPWGQEIEFVKNHVIICAHGFVGKAVWKSLSRELEGKATFPFWVLCPSRSGMKWIDETEGEGSVSVNVCSQNEAVYLCIQIGWRVVGKGRSENVAPHSTLFHGLNFSSQQPQYCMKPHWSFKSIDFVLINA